MTSTTANREDLDQVLFGVTVSKRGFDGDEVGRYFLANGLFAGGHGEPTVSGVLAFPEVGFLRAADPVLWVHPRFGGKFPERLEGLEVRRMPGAGADAVDVRPTTGTNLLENLQFVNRI